MCATSFCLVPGSTVTAQLLLLHENTCLLFRSQKSGSRVTQPDLLAHHVADPVPQLSQHRQFLTHVALSQWPVTSTQQGVGWTAALQSPVTDPGGGDTPGLLTCTEALQHPPAYTSHCTRSSLLSSHEPCQHMSAAKTHDKFLNFTPFHSLLRVFGLKMAFSFKWVCRSALSQSRGFSLISFSFE